MKTVFLLAFLIIIILSPIATAKDHTKTVCYNCHSDKGIITGDDEDGSSETCESCHSIKDNIIALEARHSQICKGCHISPKTPEEYHQIHKNVICENCHGSGLPKKPDIAITDCAGCHGAIRGGIHMTHRTRLEDICTRCHGVRPSSNPSGITDLKYTVPMVEKHGADVVVEQLDNVNKAVYAKVVDYRRYTLYEIFKILFAVFH